MAEPLRGLIGSAYDTEDYIVMYVEGRFQVYRRTGSPYRTMEEAEARCDRLQRSSDYNAKKLAEKYAS